MGCVRLICILEGAVTLLDAEGRLEDDGRSERAWEMCESPWEMSFVRVKDCEDAGRLVGVREER